LAVNPGEVVVFARAAAESRRSTEREGEELIDELRKLAKCCPKRPTGK